MTNMTEEGKRDYIKEPLTDEEFIATGRRMGMNETKAKQILIDIMKEESKLGRDFSPFYIDTKPHYKEGMIVMAGSTGQHCKIWKISGGKAEVNLVTQDPNEYLK